MPKSKKMLNYNKFFTINDRGHTVKIKQPNIQELNSLYYVLLHNLKNITKRQHI